MRIRGVLSAAAIFLGSISVATPASGTTADGVSATVLWQLVSQGTDYVFREITIAPGGSTGWHWHDGRLYGVIKAGTLTHNSADCAIDGVYPTDSSVFESSGPDRVHVGRNLGDTPLVMHVLYVLPAGSALSEDAADPGCGFG